MFNKQSILLIMINYSKTLYKTQRYATWSFSECWNYLPRTEVMATSLPELKCWTILSSHGVILWTVQCRARSWPWMFFVGPFQFRIFYYVYQTRALIFSFYLYSLRRNVSESSYQNIHKIIMSYDLSVYVWMHWKCSPVQNCRIIKVLTAWVLEILERKTWAGFWQNIVLILTGIELIFFSVPGTVLFCIQYVNKVDNTLMFWLLLSGAYRKSMIFQVFMFWQWAGEQETRKPGQDSWAELAVRIFHRMSSLVNKLGVVAGKRGCCQSAGYQLSYASLISFGIYFPLLFLIFFINISTNNNNFVSIVELLLTH